MNECSRKLPHSPGQHLTGASIPALLPPSLYFKAYGSVHVILFTHCSDGMWNLEKLV